VVVGPLLLGEAELADVHDAREDDHVDRHHEDQDAQRLHRPFERAAKHLQADRVAAELEDAEDAHEADDAHKAEAAAAVAARRREHDPERQHGCQVDHVHRIEGERAHVWAREYPHGVVDCKQHDANELNPVEDVLRSGEAASGWVGWEAGRPRRRDTHTWRARARPAGGGESAAEQRERRARHS